MHKLCKVIFDGLSNILKMAEDEAETIANLIEKNVEVSLLYAVIPHFNILFVTTFIFKCNTSIFFCLR